MKGSRLLLIGVLAVFILNFAGGNAFSDNQKNSRITPPALTQQEQVESHGEAEEHEHDIIHMITMLVMQLFVILLAAKIGGEICVRYLKQPSVLGELVMGMLIGPYALGQFMNIPGLGVLFSLPEGATTIPVSVELYSIAQIAVIILLFIAGLETDFKQFMKYAFPATVVAIGGVVFPFFFGAWATMLFIPEKSSLILIIP